MCLMHKCLQATDPKVLHFFTSLLTEAVRFNQLTELSKAKLKHQKDGDLEYQEKKHTPIKIHPNP